MFRASAVNGIGYLLALFRHASNSILELLYQTRQTKTRYTGKFSSSVLYALWLTYAVSAGAESGPSERE
jgi:hypothetical protein